MLLTVVMVLAGAVALALLAALALTCYFGPTIVRIFEETPLFGASPRHPTTDAEEVSFTTADGLRLRGSYLRTTAPARLFAAGRGPRELWLVAGAKHNRSLESAGGEYRRRLRAFLDEHLAGGRAPPSQRSSLAGVPASVVPAALPLACSSSPPVPLE